MPSIGTKRASSSSRPPPPPPPPPPPSSPETPAGTPRTCDPAAPSPRPHAWRRCTSRPPLRPPASGARVLVLVTILFPAGARASRLVVRDGCPETWSLARLSRPGRAGCLRGSPGARPSYPPARVACGGADAHPPGADRRARRPPGADRARADLPRRGDPAPDAAPGPAPAGAVHRARRAARRLQPRGPRGGAVRPQRRQDDADADDPPPRGGGRLPGLRPAGPPGAHAHVAQAVRPSRRGAGDRGARRLAAEPRSNEEIRERVWAL